MSRELIAEQLKIAMGLHSPTVGMVTVSSAIDKRMRICEIDSDNEYLMRIRTNPDEMKALTEAVIIPETWFFREHEPYKYVLKYFHEQNPAQRLNILSIPCSTGEEPYSIAMMLMDNNIQDTRYHIDAVDIADKNINKARIGIYGKNSFRSEDLRFMHRHFKKEKGKELFAISDKVKQKVDFHCENVLSDSFSLALKRYDIIFCRNLLIYFDRETQHKMLSTLEKMLAPKGILILGHAETVQYSDDSLVPAVDSKSYVYVKKSNLEKALKPQHKNPRGSLTDNRKHTRPIKLVARPFSNVKRENESAKKDISITANEQLGIAFELANEGRLDEALEICTRYIENNDSSRAFYLSGVIYDTKGDSNKAYKMLHKAIYLDPENLEALIHLSLIAEQRGDHDEAMRLKNRAQRVQERRKV